MAGKQLHLQTTRIFQLLSGDERYKDRDCPAQMTEDEEAMVLAAIRKEGQHRSHYSCLLRTHSLQADVENCTRHWVNSCSDPADADLLRQYLEERYASSE